MTRVQFVACLGGCAGLALGALVGAILGLVGPLASSVMCALVLGAFASFAGAVVASKELAK